MAAIVIVAMIQSTKTLIEIEGWPVYRGERLQPESPIFNSLHTIAQLAEFARQIRGPFSIIIRGQDEVTAITDFAGHFPVYWIRTQDRDSIRVASCVASLRSHSQQELSVLAIYWWIRHRGVGPYPFFSDIALMKPASILHVSGSDISEVEYIDWGNIANNGPDTFEAARERFIEIATSYLSAVSKPEGGSLACFLSGGTDSAVVAHLAKLAGVTVVGLTADYSFKRYSEFDLAARNARQIAIEHHAVDVKYRKNREAMFRMNDEMSDAPASHSQMTSLVALGDAALELGLQGWLSGDRVGSLFLEFDYFFRGLPTSTQAFEEAARRMSADTYLDRFARYSLVDEVGSALLLAFDLNRIGFEDWVSHRETADRAERSRLFSLLGYPLALQVDDLRHSGITHRCCTLPAQRAVGAGSQILNPFLDIEMIRFVLSLPLHLKYRNGTGKWFLREFLRRELGITLPKRASPNPSRVWWLPPRPDDQLRVDSRLRPLLACLQIRNALTVGKYYKDLFDLTALGIWLRTH